MSPEEIMAARQRHGMPTRVTVESDKGRATVWAFCRIQAECAAALELGCSLWDLRGAALRLAKEE